MNTYCVTKLFLIIAVVGLLTAANLRGASAQSVDWVQVGPEGGMITSIEFDPVTPTTLYVTTEGGGVYKSIDGGEQWNAINAGLFGGGSAREQGLWAADLVVDPNNPSTLYTIHFAGFFKSVDGGETWSEVSNPWGDFTSLAIDPVIPTTLYATRRGLPMTRSTDGGNSWVDLSIGTDRKVVFDPFVHTTVYATSYDGLAKSASGENWRWLNTPDSMCGVIALDPTTQDTLYATTCAPDESGSIAGISRSVDGGMSWSQVADGLGADCLHGCRITMLKADPASPGMLYAGTYDGRIYKSIDAGETWQNVVGIWPVQGRFAKITDNCHFACDTAPVVCSNGAPAICGNDAPLLGDELAGQFAAKLNQVTARLLSDGYPSCHGEKTRQGGINVKQEKRERGHTKHLAPYPAGRQ